MPTLAWACYWRSSLSGGSECPAIAIGMSSSLDGGRTLDQYRFWATVTS
jgi:hypothetical protein